MKRCPICDKEVKGRFCKSCMRFVTPYEVKSNMYINESHKMSDDSSCDYHDQSEFIRQEQEADRWVSNQQTTVLHPSSANRNNLGSEHQKRVTQNRNTTYVANKKTVVIVVLVLIFIMVLPAIAGIVSYITIIRTELERKEQKSKQTEIQATINPDEVDEFADILTALGENSLDEEARLELFQYVNIPYANMVAEYLPENVEVNKENACFYYSTSQAQSIPLRCMVAHLPMTEEKAERLLKNESDKIIENLKQEINMILIDKMGYVVSFTQMTTLECSGVTVFMSADSVTKELHELDFFFMEGDEAGALVHPFMRNLFDNYVLSENEMKQLLRDEILEGANLPDGEVLKKEIFSDSYRSLILFGGEEIGYTLYIVTE